MKQRKTAEVTAADAPTAAVKAAMANISNEVKTFSPLFLFAFSGETRLKIYQSKPLLIIQTEYFLSGCICCQFRDQSQVPISLTSKFLRTKSKKSSNIYLVKFGSIMHQAIKANPFLFRHTKLFFTSPSNIKLAFPPPAPAVDFFHHTFVLSGFKENVSSSFSSSSSSLQFPISSKGGNSRRRTTLLSPISVAQSCPFLKRKAPFSSIYQGRRISFLIPLRYYIFSLAVL